MIENQVKEIEVDTEKENLQGIDCMQEYPLHLPFPVIHVIGKNMNRRFELVK